MSLRVAIVDDECLARERLRVLLAAHHDVCVIAECADGGEAISTIGRLQPDVIFLDVQMPEMSGFELLQQIPPAVLPLIVFVTAYDHYAVRAFEENAVDYLVKPFTQARLADALQRARVRLAMPAASGIALQTGRDTLIVPLEEIDWIEGANNYACVHCGGRTHIVRETLRSLERRLPARIFVRIHRSTIVNARRVRRIEPVLNGDHRVMLDGGAVLTLSRTYASRLHLLVRFE